MNDLLFLLGFSLFPLLTASIYAVAAPGLGAALYLRDEMLLGIVLPPFGAAVIGLSVIRSVSPENRLLLQCIVAVALFIALNLPVFQGGTETGSGRRKEMVLAALFVAGQTVTYLAMHLSPAVNANLSYLLSGEILSAGAAELWTSLAISGLLGGAFLRYRGLFYAYCLDESGLKIGNRGFRRIEIAYRMAASIIITAALVCVGPLLTTAWLILPALFAERATSNIERFFAVSVALGVTGTIAGFVSALVIDYPPAYVIATVIFWMGIVLAAARRPGVT